MPYARTQRNDGSAKTMDDSFLNGVVVTSNTAAVAGSFRAIQVLVAATFATFTELNVTGQAMTGFAIPAGTVIYGDITGYSLTSGTVRAYVK